MAGGGISLPRRKLGSRRRAYLRKGLTFYLGFPEADFLLLLARSRGMIIGPERYLLLGTILYAQPLDM